MAERAPIHACILSLIVCVGSSVAAAQTPALVMCRDIAEIQARAKLGPAADTLADAGQHHAIAEATECAPVSDAEKRAYRCAWQFTLGSPAAMATFDAFVETARQCVGRDAVERTGEPVNHPDAFLAHYFEHPHASLSVSLKHKSALRQTLVSIRSEHIKR